VNDLLDFFITDWAAMTSADWFGLIVVLALSTLMIALYIWVFRPSNRQKFEQYRDFVNNEHIEEAIDREVRHGQTK